jgi:hypothetical protein
VVSGRCDQQADRHCSDRIGVPTLHVRNAMRSGLAMNSA